LYHARSACVEGIEECEHSSDAFIDVGALESNVELSCTIQNIIENTIPRITKNDDDHVTRCEDNADNILAEGHMSTTCGK